MVCIRIPSVGIVWSDVRIWATGRPAWPAGPNSWPSQPQPCNYNGVIYQGLIIMRTLKSVLWILTSFKIAIWIRIQRFKKQSVSESNIKKIQIRTQGPKKAQSTIQIHNTTKFSFFYYLLEFFLFLGGGGLGI